ncbi:hypothetical protein OIU78_017607 [Salix suchowensis]|nr:hypothetical protein OIU78_017607 [Salix suchowensis]
MDMAQLICRGCRSLLMYPHGATSVRCSCCHAVNLAPGYNQLAHVNCGNCWTTLMYPNGSPSVKCPVCQYVTNVSMANMRVPLPQTDLMVQVEHHHLLQCKSAVFVLLPVPMPHSQTQTVVVENPMSVDESGKLVSNVVVGVTTDKKNTPVRF